MHSRVTSINTTTGSFSPVEASFPTCRIKQWTRWKSYSKKDRRIFRVTLKFGVYSVLLVDWKQPVVDLQRQNRQCRVTQAAARGCVVVGE